MLIKIKNKAYNFASNIGVELDLLELLYFQFRTKFDAKLYALYSISLQIWCEIEYKAYGLAPNFRRFFFSNDVESFNFVEEGDDEKQQLMIVCSCYNGVRGLCTHILATEMYLCQRKRPSEEKMLSNRRKKGRLPKNSKIQKFWFKI